MKKILVIGASGLVGSNIYKLFLERKKYSIEGTYLNEPVNNLTHLDISNQASLNQVASHRWDVIVHTAALTNVDQCEENPKLSNKLNVEGTLRIMDLAVKCNALLVFISTDYIFDGKNGPYTEDSTPNPINVYGEHKLICENSIKSTISNNSLILRITNVYGDENLGKNFIARLITFIKLNEKKVIELANDQFATPVNAQNLGEALYKLIESNKIGVYNISSDEYFNRCSLAELVIGYYKSDRVKIIQKSTEELKQKARRPLRGGLINSKFLNDFPDFKFTRVMDYLNQKSNV